MPRIPRISLTALRDLARQYNENDVADLIAPLIINADGSDIKEPFERYKLYPTRYDRGLFCDLIDLNRESLRRTYATEFYKNGKVRESTELLPLRAWEFFRSESDRFINEDGADSRVERLAALSSTLLEAFEVIVITLDEHDDAQVIFETLNAGGEPLAAMDLVRNDVFQRATRSGENVETIMEKRWRVFEDPLDATFWKATAFRGRIKKPRVDFFLSDILAAETSKEILLTELYARYKEFVSERKFPSVDAELDVLLRYAPIFRELEEPSGSSPISRLARQLAAFDVTTAFPLVFVVAKSNAPEDEKTALYQLILSYVVRRTICGLSSKNLNNVFLRISSALRTKDSGITVMSATSIFRDLDGETNRFPTDTEFSNAIEKRPQYGYMQQRRLRHILCEIEYAARDKFDETTVLSNDLTIEHILPEGWMQHWPLPDGTHAAIDLLTGMTESQLRLIAEREALKHTLGNLTLVTAPRNANLSHFGFESKRDKFKQALLRLNHDVADQVEWSEGQIQARARRLAELAINIWPGL